MTESEKVGERRCERSGEKRGERREGVGRDEEIVRYIEIDTNQ